MIHIPCLESRLVAVRRDCAALRRLGLQARPARLPDGPHVVVDARTDHDAHRARVALPLWLAHHFPGLPALDWAAIDSDVLVALTVSKPVTAALLPAPAGGWRSVTPLCVEAVADGAAWQLAVAHRSGPSEPHEVFFETFPRAPTARLDTRVPGWIAGHRVPVRVVLGRSAVRPRLLTRMSIGDLLVIERVDARLECGPGPAAHGLFRVKVMERNIALTESWDDEALPAMPHGQWEEAPRPLADESPAEAMARDDCHSGDGSMWGGSPDRAAHGDDGWPSDLPPGADRPPPRSTASHTAAAAPAIVPTALTASTPAIQDVPVQATFVLDELTLSFGELAQLETGATLPLRQGCLSRVDIRIDGTRVAHGRLVRLEDGLAVEIDALHVSSGAGG
ncbi:FliM/FliN family flagellar motor switch protein [Chitinasiproducens palmae]|uniref:Type III secretion system apparatus protein YscQ/HrcQ n=1 Tax=Chitinasiproducens palmae TaxID=1770053 RepID=A0A1H2PIX6_9BURK|nr:FliM/FliN family flagellar motor switch protein [Chitinasiproducens palmae]SDV46281.1 type III secretion system apparatus protein YscQ/HrcQ [Chitinasiproducens palmae]